jgi:hypothetical protein
LVKFLFNLNGEWEFAFDDTNRGLIERWYLKESANNFDKKIIVPFCFQSKLSGIEDTSFHEVFWYKKEFKIQKHFENKKVLLHFGAIDYRCVIYLNEVYVGSHEGGYIGFYYIDSLLGLFIALLIIFDGIKTLIELIKSGNNIEIDTFKLKIDESFEVKIVDWLLMTIQEESLSEEELNNRFIEAIEKGYEIFDIWAIFGLYDIKKFGVYKILNLMKKRGLIIENNDNISLTDKGKKYYGRIVAQEIKKVSRENKKYQEWKQPRKIIKILWFLLGFGLPIIIILLLIFVGPNLYNFIIYFFKGY